MDPSINGGPTMFYCSQLFFFSAALTFWLPELCAAWPASKAEYYHQDMPSQNISVYYTERKKGNKTANLMAPHQRNYLGNGKLNK